VGANDASVVGFGITCGRPPPSGSPGESAAGEPGQPRSPLWTRPWDVGRKTLGRPHFSRPAQPTGICGEGGRNAFFGRFSGSGLIVSRAAQSLTANARPKWWLTPASQIRLRDGTSWLADGRIADARHPRPDPSASPCFPVAQVFNLCPVAFQALPKKAFASRTKSSGGMSSARMFAARSSVA